MKLSQAEIDELVRRGAVVGPAVQLPKPEAEPEEPKDVKLIEPAIWAATGRPMEPLEIHVAIHTVSEINSRDWKGRQKRTKEARKAVREAIGSHLGLLEPFAKAYASGNALRVTFTRLGGRKMDRMANLGPSMKAVEDAIAYLLNASDGDPRWHATAEQEPGPGPVGVRITLEEYQ